MLYIVWVRNSYLIHFISDVVIQLAWNKMKREMPKGYSLAFAIALVWTDFTFDECILG